MNIVIVSFLPNASPDIYASDAQGDLPKAHKSLRDFASSAHTLLSKDSVRDRALNYGDGCFTTMYGNSSGLFLFDKHLQRLAKDCDRLGIAVCSNTIESWLLLAVKDMVDADVPAYALKVLVSRGSGGRGYELPEKSNASIIVSLFECADFLQMLSHTNDYHFTLKQASMTLSSQPLLAGIKHLNRLEQILAKRELQQYSCQDIVLCDSHGHMIEATSANLFYLKRGVWYTPYTDTCGVDGVMRAAVLAYFAHGKIQHQLCRMPFTDLVNADAIFLCNAIKFVTPVSAVMMQDKVYNMQLLPSFALATKLFHWISEHHQRKVKG